MKVLERVFYLFFLLPIFPALFGFGYEQTKLGLFLVLILFCGLRYTYLLHKKKVTIRWERIQIAAVCFFSILSLASVIGLDFSQSLLGTYPYYQGLIFYWLLFLVFLIASTIKLQIKWVRELLSISALIVSILSITQFLFLNFLGVQEINYAGRVISTFGQPNLYSGFLLMALPLIFEKTKKSYFLSAGICLSIFLSYSRTAIFLVSLLIFWFFVYKLRIRTIIFLTALLVVLISLFLSTKYQSGVVWDEFIQPVRGWGVDDDNYEKRIRILPVMADIAGEGLLKGFGVDSVSRAYRDHYRNFSPETIAYDPIEFHLKNLVIDRSHNYFLDLLIFSGVPGLLSYLIFFSFILKKSKGVFRVFFLLYIIWVQFQVQSVIHLLMFWIIAGFVDSKVFLKQYKNNASS